MEAVLQQNPSQSREDIRLNATRAERWKTGEVGSTATTREEPIFARRTVLILIIYLTKLLGAED